MDHFSNKPNTDFSNDQDNSISDDPSSQTDVSEAQEHTLCGRISKSHKRQIVS
ncbi:hypothetical protein RhiirB3_452216 [Rhizophagus irregularis]|nr:hypothetical protein RhiirB3_452216 [Rhizophagus irregularis]